jgi:hypothetical protein
MKINSKSKKGNTESQGRKHWSLTKNKIYLCEVDRIIEGKVMRK